MLRFRLYIRPFSTRIPVGGRVVSAIYELYFISSINYLSITRRLTVDNRELDDFEQMDPDFGRAAPVGEGFGQISDEDYALLIQELESKE